MKKVLLSLLISILVIPGVFAADLSTKAVLTQGVNLGPASSTNEWGAQKSRVIFQLAGDQVNSVLVTNVDGGDGFAVDYAWADVQLTQGTLRVGKQRLGLANYGGGIYQTNTFLGLTACKNWGISYATKLSDYNVKVFNAVSTVEKEALKIYAAKVDTTINGTYVGANLIAGSQDDNNGLAAEVEAQGTVGPVKLSGQYYMDINHNAAVIFKGKAKKEAFLGLYAESSNDLGKIYGDYVMAGNDDTKAQWGNESELSLGVAYNLIKGVKAYFEVTSTKPNGADANGSSSIAIEAKI